MADENYMIELFRQSDTECRQRMISYLALLDVCKQINDNARFKKQQRNVSVIQDIDGNNIVMICQVSIADQNIHIVSKEQMRKRKQMLYKEFLK